MRQSHTLRRGAMLVLGVTAALTFAATAGAEQWLREPVHEEDAFVWSDFCDVHGMTVDVKLVREGRLQAVGHGPDHVAYFLSPLTQTRVYTNRANGKSISDYGRFIEKDLHVTDNGDGTLTILVLTTGNLVVYDQAGKVISRNPGQLRFEVLIDHGGTPADPFDDEFLADLGVVKGSTGRSDDFCAAAVPALR
jgi:hypothetical protein